MSGTIAKSRTTVVLGDLRGWRTRLVYRSVGPVVSTVSDDGRFCTILVPGGEQVAAVITPAGHPEPVVYLGADVPDQPWTSADGWVPADMPRGVVGNPVRTDVLALTWSAGQVSGYAKSVWLDRAYRPMERFSLPVSSPGEQTATVACRVLEVGVDPFLQEAEAPYLIVGVADADPLREHGWEEQAWVGIRAAHWMDLDGLSRCIESKAYGCMDAAILGEVVLHDILSMDIAVLPMLPRDVRDGLERTLLAMPD